jgi:hypothetical protein
MREQPADDPAVAKAAQLFTLKGVGINSKRSVNPVLPDLDRGSTFAAHMRRTAWRDREEIAMSSG